MISFTKFITSTFFAKFAIHFHFDVDIKIRDLIIDKLIVTNKCFIYDKSNHIWKKMFECLQISKTSLTQNANVLYKFDYRIKRFWFEKLTIHIKNAIDECLKIFFIHDDNMFDSFMKRFSIINRTLSFNDNKHKLKILINIDAIDYAFIDKEIAQFVDNTLNIKFVSLLKSKFFIKFDDCHVSLIIHIIYFKLTIKLSWIVLELMQLLIS